MKVLVVFSCLVAAALAKPGFIAGYAAIVPGAPIGADGRVVDEPAVALAKAEHAAAHVNERINLNNEAIRSADLLIPAAPAPYVAAAALPLAHPAPAILAADPRPLDTPEVALAKAAHLNAHAFEKARHYGLVY